MKDGNTRKPDPLSALLAMPLKKRIVAVAEDLQSGTDRFRRIEAFELADALGVPQPESPSSAEWTFTSYAERETVEELVEKGTDSSEILGLLEPHVGARRFKSLEKAFARLEETDKPSFDFLTAKERSAVEETIAQRQLEANQSNGMNCVASYCVGRGKLALWFQAVIEDDGNCYELKTPYDERDGKCLDLTDCVTDGW